MLWLSMTALSSLTLWVDCESTVSRLWVDCEVCLPTSFVFTPGRRPAPHGAVRDVRAVAKPTEDQEALWRTERLKQGPFRVCVYIYIILYNYVYIGQLQANYYLHASSHLLDWNWLCIPFVALTHRPFWNTPKGPRNSGHEWLKGLAWLGQKLW